MKYPNIPYIPYMTSFSITILYIYIFIYVVLETVGIWGIWGIKRVTEKSSLFCKSVKGGVFQKRQKWAKKEILISANGQGGSLLKKTKLKKKR